MTLDSPSQSTVAIVVGIERYKAGSTWNLDGPASDAVRFMEYLHARGVPTASIHALLNTLPENRDDLLARANACTSNPINEPLAEAVRAVITKTLVPLRSGLLLFFWAGHGVITLEGERRLFTADAETNDKRNIDFNDLLATLRTSLYPGLSRQAFIVDTCANYFHNPAISLPNDALPKGDPLAGREQFALFAAGPGEYATNLNTEKTGLMSRELMTILEALPVDGSTAIWPPDFSNGAQRLTKRFIELRREGVTKQTPTSFSFREWNGTEHFLADVDSLVVPEKDKPSANIDLEQALDSSNVLRVRRILLAEAKAVRHRLDALDENLITEDGYITSAKYIDAFKALEFEGRGLREMLAIACYKDEKAVFNVVTECIKLIASMGNNAGVQRVWANLKLYPALTLIYSCGLILLAEEKYESLARLLSQVKILDLHSSAGSLEEPLALIVTPDRVVSLKQHELSEDSYGDWLARDLKSWTPVSSALFHLLKDEMSLFFPDAADFKANFDKFQYLYSLIHADLSDKKKKEKLSTDGFLGNSLEIQLLGQPPAIHEYPAKLPEFLTEIGVDMIRQGAELPLLKAGLFDSSINRLRLVMDGMNERFLGRIRDIRRN